MACLCGRGRVAVLQIPRGDFLGPRPQRVSCVKSSRGERLHEEALYRVRTCLLLLLRESVQLVEVGPQVSISLLVQARRPIP
jgi:hypothetical protein